MLARSTRTAFPAGVHVVVETSFSRTTFERVLPETDCAIYAIGLPEQFSFDSSVFERVNHGLLCTFGEVTEFAERTAVRLTTIHPAALYGGLNTGDGITGAVENLLGRRFWRFCRRAGSRWCTPSRWPTGCSAAWAPSPTGESGRSSSATA